jgi:hypothetical protein
MAIEVLPLTEFAVNALLNINQPSTSNLFLPVPEKDGIYGLFYAIHKDVCNQDKEPDIVGGFVVDVISFYKEHCPEIEIVDSEIMLFHKIVAVIEKYVEICLVQRCGKICDTSSERRTYFSKKLIFSKSGPSVPN